MFGKKPKKDKAAEADDAAATPVPEGEEGAEGAPAKKKIPLMFLIGGGVGAVAILGDGDYGGQGLGKEAEAAYGAR